MGTKQNRIQHYFKSAILCELIKGYNYIYIATSSCCYVIITECHRYHQIADGT